MRREKDQYTLAEINPQLSGEVNCMDSPDLLLGRETGDTGLYSDLFVECF